MKNNEVIVFRLDSSTRNILTELAILRHMSVSSLCRYIIKTYLLLLQKQQVEPSDSAAGNDDDKEYFENAPY